MSEQGRDAQHREHGHKKNALRKLRATSKNEERRQILHSVSERSFCEPTMNSGNWNTRHCLTFTNDGLNPNYRSYFDRHLAYKEPGSDALGPLKPSWRLTPDKTDLGEREEMRLAQQWFSSCNVPTRSSASGTLPDRERERLPQLPKEPPAQLKSIAKRPKPGGGGECHSRLFEGVEPSPDALFSADPDVLASVAKRDSTERWDNHHHVTWSNEKSVGSKLLNPVQTRNYFDRLRTPAPGDRSVQMHSSSEGQDSLSSTMRSIRAMPVWRLNASQEGVARSLDGTLSNMDSFVERSRPLLSHTGTGGGLRRCASDTTMHSVASAGKRASSPTKGKGKLSTTDTDTGRLSVLTSRSFAMCLSAPPPQVC